MRHRRGLKKRYGHAKTRAPITGDTTVYSAAAWWRDSDPSMQAVALTHKKAETEIRKQIKDAARTAARDDESYPSINAALDDIAWSGVHPMRLGALASARELEQAIADLEDSGVWYPERG
jgi:hypothetical protein